MILVTREYGQLGNRLRLYAHLMAAAIEYDVSLYFPHFREYAMHFPTLRKDWWCRYPQVVPDDQPPSRLMQRHEDALRQFICNQVFESRYRLSQIGFTRFPANVICISEDETCDLNTPRFKRMAQSVKPLLVDGWMFRSWDLLDKHADQIRNHFRILDAHQTQVDATIASLRKPGCKVVGVHIRHGDYEEWRDGCYFYSIEEYAAHMRQIADLNHGSETRFLVCTNAAVTEQDFPGLDVTLSSGHLIEDLYALAETDLILGPPSTFSGWSAFYGKKPKLTLKRRESQPNLFDQAELHSAMELAAAS
ncbi:hypothetical protein SAMN06265222_11113 [Neorhodopirellula lusitana]|uniref:Glycosyl transferase family 11 n=1 Tax=Neorhodopirellula lusitana TaxID=445327 RepID=A0ABY1QDG8_9BACT|nr:hypothetical protein [Neorhodopirellula lusitana]SMP68175.1 hypothetical protein SAMN06265222_11113 [Neorhodopirellula lusitana]